MTSFSFIHAADLHLGTPFKNLGECDVKWRERLREAPFRAFERIIRLCIEKGVDFLVLAGDVYDSSEQNLRAQVRFRDGLARLAQHGIKTYIAKGNHDYGDATGARFSWPDGVCFFPEGQVGSFLHRKNGEVVAELLGISYPDQNTTQNYARSFRKSGRANYTIGVLHSNVGGQPGYDNYAPCSLADLRAASLDYWALGHVHRKLVLSQMDPVIAYPGPPQGRSARETGPKGCFLVEVIGTKTSCTFLPTAEVLRETISLDITPWEKLEDLFSGLEEAIETYAGSAGYLVARVELTGRGLLHKELAAEETRAELLEEFRGRSFRGFRGVYLDDLVIRTDPEIDKEAERRSQTITADFLRALAELTEEEGAPQVAAALSSLYDSKYRRYLELPRGGELSELIRAAENTGLDLLLGEED